MNTAGKDPSWGFPSFSVTIRGNRLTIQSYYKAEKFLSALLQLAQGKFMDRCHAYRYLSVRGLLVRNEPRSTDPIRALLSKASLNDT